MKIQLLGTGGAEGIPALFSNSEVSLYARKHGGKDVRTRSSALIDDCLKIDLPPDILTQIQLHDVDARLWTSIFFTHSHDDHFARNELQYALYPFTPDEYPGFTIFGNDTICGKVRERYPDWPFELFRTCSFVPVQHMDYTVTPIRAHHKLDEDSHNLIIQRGGKTFLYGTDTGTWLEETWEFLQDFKLDGLVIECTEGFFRTCYYGHMDIQECMAAVDRLRTMGVLQEGAPVVSTHHSHLGGATHAQLEQALRPAGIEPGYDGMVIEL